MESKSNNTSKSNILNDKFSRVMRQLRQKNGQLGNKRQRGITVGSKINTGLRKDYDQHKENYNGAKTLDDLTGEHEFVSTELQRFVDNQADVTAGHTIHSPMHNRFDAVRDSDVYNSIGSSSGWKSIL